MDVLVGFVFNIYKVFVWVRHRDAAVVLNHACVWEPLQKFLKIPVPGSTLGQFHQSVVRVGISISKDSKVWPSLRTRGGSFTALAVKGCCKSELPGQFGTAQMPGTIFRDSGPVSLRRGCPVNRIPREFCICQSLRTGITLLKSMIMTLLLTGKKRLREVK